MKFQLLLGALVFSGTLVHADLLALTPASPAASNTGVVLSSAASAIENNQTYNMVSVGNGLRQKQVFGMVNIYVGQLFVADASRYVKTASGALPSLDTQSAVALVMSFLFSPPTFLVTQDFNAAAAAAANNISPNDPDIAAFMKVMGSLSFRNGGEVTLFFVKGSDGNYSLYIEDKLSASATSSPIPPVALSSLGLHKVLSLWLGNPADDGLAAFQKQLMQ